MRGPATYDEKLVEMKPTKSEINWVIMDYLVSEGYPGAAEKFAQETNLCRPADIESIRERVRIRNAIHSGQIEEAIAMINDVDPQILDTTPHLHFSLLKLQLIELMRPHLSTATINNPPSAQSFAQAMQFATEQLAPRAPTSQAYLTALEETMALMIYTPAKMPPTQQKLMDKQLRESIAAEVNRAVLTARGGRSEAKLPGLVRARVWAEALARENKVEVPGGVGLEGGDGDAIMS